MKLDLKIDSKGWTWHVNGKEFRHNLTSYGSKSDYSDDALVAAAGEGIAAAILSADIIDLAKACS